MMSLRMIIPSVHPVSMTVYDEIDNGAGVASAQDVQANDWFKVLVDVALESWPETDRIMASGYTPGNRS